MRNSIIAMILAVAGFTSAQAQETTKKYFEDCTYKNVEASYEDGKLTERMEWSFRSQLEKTRQKGAAENTIVFDQFGDVETESHQLHDDGTKTKTNEMKYSTVGKINREKRELGENRYFQLDSKQSVHTAKEGFSFRLPGGGTSQTKAVNTTIEMVYFDDGKTSKIEYMKVNGDLAPEGSGEYEESEYQDGEYTVYVSRLKAPFSYNDSNTVVEADDSVCRRKNLN